MASRLGKQNEAVAHLRQCILQRPENPALRLQVAGCLYALNRLPEALRECDESLRLDPDNSESYRSRIYVRGRLGELDGLQADLSRLDLLTRKRGRDTLWGLRLNTPFQPRRLDPLLRAAGPGGELPRAEEIDAADVDLRVYLANVNLLRNVPAERVLPDLDKALDADPDHILARYLRAVALRDLGRDNAGREFEIVVSHPRFDEFLLRVPVAVDAYQFLSEDLIKRGELDQAVRVAEHGLASAKTLDTMVAESHYSVARAYAAASAARPDLLPRVAAELKETARLRPRLIVEGFETDAVFDAVRSRVRPRLQNGGRASL
jgi:tetratricopeptide (TPR) repeat protein